MINEYLSIASIAEEGSSECSNVSWRLDPAGSLDIKLTELLQLSVLLFRQKFDAHRGSHLDCAVLRLVLLPGLTRFSVVTGTSASYRTFCGAVTEGEVSGVLILANDIRFTACGLHLS